MRASSTKLVPLAAGVLITSVGAGLLVFSVREGERASAVTVEIGVAIALSGMIWRVGRQIRGQSPRLRADYSAVMLTTLIGGVVVGVGIHAGADSSEVELAAGASLVTVWLFIGLERQYELRPDGVPLLLRPLAVLLWPLSGFFDGLGLWGDVSGPFDGENLITQLRIDAELSGEYRVPGSSEQDFSPSPEEVQRRLQIELPKELVTWITATTGRRLRLTGGGELFVWPWLLIQMAPVEVPPKVICFADLWTSPDGSNRYAIAIDLRSGPDEASVVRAKTGSGDMPKWPADAPEAIASKFADWRNSIRLSSAPAAYGEAIRKLRDDRGLSQEHVATLSNLSPAYIHGIESGEEDPGLADLLKVADALRVQISEIALAAEEAPGFRSK